PREALERRADRTARLAVASQEALLERAVAGEDVAGRHAERRQVARSVEAIDEALEARAIPLRVEVTNEGGGRRGNHGEPAIQRPAKDLDAAVRQARRQQRHDLAVGGVRVTPWILDRVALEARIVVEIAIEPLERLLQRGG